MKIMLTFKNNICAVDVIFGISHMVAESTLMLYDYVAYMSFIITSANIRLNCIFCQQAALWNTFYWSVLPPNFAVCRFLSFTFSGITGISKIFFKEFQL